MQIDVQLTRERIPDSLAPVTPGGIGAWVEFRGVIRDQESGAAITALEYEAYSPMAEAEMRRILLEIAGKRPCMAARVIHRIGIVPVGEAAIYVGVAGSHRGETFSLVTAFMDRLKKDVPIWKVRSLPATETSECCAAGKGHSAADVLALLRRICTPLPSERVPLSEARGRVLRDPVTAPEDQPAFDRSSVDGYAVRQDDTNTRFTIVDEVRAGEWKPRDLQPGETIQVSTGAAVPGSGLRIVMKEEVKVAGQEISILERNSDRNIRFRGEDAAAGQALVEPGVTLRPGTLALLASVGCTRPVVNRLPRVLHLATGDEIVAPDQRPGHGQIRDSNSVLVKEFLAGWGIVPAQSRVGEAEAHIEKALACVNGETDLILISGGASVGEHDFTRRLLERVGFTIHVTKTATRPGKPLIVAQRGRVVAFGLPGNPLAHFVCLNLYVRAALESWSGATTVSALQDGGLAADVNAGGGPRETYWPALWEFQEGRARITPLSWTSSGDLTALATANALIQVPSGTKQMHDGTAVSFLPLNLA